MTLCPLCGTEPPDGALFCPSCGARTTVRPDVVAAQPAWDTDRPAIPEDLFRPPVEEPLATPDDELFRPPDTTADPEATAVRPAPPPTMPSPAWAYRPGTPEADLLPSERPQVPPPGEAPGRSHVPPPGHIPPPPGRAARPAHGNVSGSRGVIILLAILVIAAIVGGVLWFTDGGSPSAGSSPSKSASPAASASGGTASGTPSKGQSATVTPSAPPSDAFPPAGATLCAGSTTVAINAATSCPFALNVAAAIPAGSTGSFTVTANSPATNKDYQMACVRGTYTVCTGGVNALVYVK